MAQKTFCDLCESEIPRASLPAVQLRVWVETHPHDNKDIAGNIDACHGCLVKLSPLPVNGQLKACRKKVAES